MVQAVNIMATNEGKQIDRTIIVNHNVGYTTDVRKGANAIMSKGRVSLSDISVAHYLSC